MLIQNNKSTQSGCWPPDDAGGRRDNKRNFFGKLFKNRTSSTPEQAVADEGAKRQTEHCMVCSEPLEYHDKAKDVVCTYCGSKLSGHITCPSGHFICDTCHNHDAMLVIENVILTSKDNDPIKIAGIAMSFPGLPMLGCQHACIAGGALMAAVKNSGSKDITNDDIKEVFSRTRQQAHGGYCGLTGVCGITPAIGACISVLTGSKCGRDKEQRLTMELTTKISKVITELTGPSCCKAYVWASLEAAIPFFREHLGIEMYSRDKVDCRYTEKHPHGCRLEKCSYYFEEARWTTPSTSTRNFLLSPMQTEQSTSRQSIW